MMSYFENASAKPCRSVIFASAKTTKKSPIKSIIESVIMDNIDPRVKTIPRTGGKITENVFVWYHFCVAKFSLQEVLQK